MMPGLLLSLSFFFLTESKIAVYSMNPQISIYTSDKRWDIELITM